MAPESTASIATPEARGPLIPPPVPEIRAPRPPRRRALAIIVGAAVALGLGGYGIHLYLTRFDMDTDDAHVDFDVVPLSSRVSGEVARVPVQENQAVKKGDLLVVLDHEDYALEVKQAEAGLDTARAQASAADADVDAAEAGLRRAGVEAGKAESDLQRAEQLFKGEAIAPEKLDAAKATGGVSKAGVASARARYAAAVAQEKLSHARVKATEAALGLARLQLSYTKIWAPEDGVISKLAVREGQLVAAGQPVAELVPVESYVVANFKETQVGKMRAGQPAEVQIDAFPGRTFEGKVESLSGGTGARFALIPPDNASGNFVKVVERVPVRIAWSKPLPADVRLLAGLSAYVTVNTR